ncbi:hypothetical protein N7468_006724 [Penicillium chermesinum]|uniref:Arf-GAP domain-containing protein n=1 Tax=Penicillium chermesinum TaxID=63820 RepID=A0A9W9TK38_9EURO|nr:uncharacterized protein N7468_006724 [Penicillium chermesinum]KAJ5225499.1 hypothetical protein N7468_006724 [Penicillium chermesinum]
MPNGISKRQQLRNEKALAELVRSVPGNDRCADCEALTPGWASWNMGIFLCMRCASIHRKLGTHISKVKSLSMDTWSAEQVDNMKSHGNLLMNKIYNPRNVKPPVPTDVDETDSALERYLRAKYQYRTLAEGKPKPPSRSDESYSRSREGPRSRSPESPEGSPPPLPPNPDPRHHLTNGPLHPPKRSTSGLGAPVADVTTASFEAKMAAMREMGFTNDRRNEMVLKGLNEDLDRSIATLQRLGEGNGLPVTRSKTPTATRADTSVPPPMPPRPATQGNASNSTNPFDKLDATQTEQVPPVPQSQATLSAQTASYNPFDQPARTPQSAQPLEASFQNLQVTQPLFPHSTGGYPQHANSLPQLTAYQQPFTPPGDGDLRAEWLHIFPASPPQLQGGMANQPQSNAGAVQNNPFFSNQPQNGLAQSQLQQNGIPRPPQHANTMPTLSSTSSFGTSPFGAAPSGNFQSQQQPQQQPQGLAQGSHNPFQQSMGPSTPQSAGFTNSFPTQQPQQLAPQATGRVDKGNILSLYGSAPTAPVPAIPQQHLVQSGLGTSPTPPVPNSFGSTQFGAGNISNASRNPFDGPAPAAPPAPAGSGLAAQAGINTFQPSAGLGLGLGTNGTSSQPLQTGNGVNMSTGLGVGLKSNNPFPSSTTSPFARPPIHSHLPAITPSLLSTTTLILRSPQVLPFLALT